MGSEPCGCKLRPRRLKEPFWRCGCPARSSDQLNKHTTADSVAESWPLPQVLEKSETPPHPPGTSEGNATRGRAHLAEAGVLDGILRQSTGNLRKVRNLDKSTLARERKRSVAALGLRDTENPMIARVIDRDGAPVVNHQSARIRENCVSKIVLSTHRTWPPQSGRPPVRRSRH
jgi:hypothetical protein